MLKVLLVAVLLTAGVQQPAAPPVSPPGTDIYEISFTAISDALKNAKPQAISAEPGYENQPFFTPDGAAILFTANRDGKQTDIYEFDRKTRRVRQLVATPEGEYSPTVTPDGKGFSVIRVEADGTQRLWRFDRAGANPQVVLKEIKPVGYHAWIDADQLALFVLGQPATLQHARVSTGKATVIAQNIGRSLHRIPNSPHVSFVHREAPDKLVVKRLDPATGAVTPLVSAQIAESAATASGQAREKGGPPTTAAPDRDVAWMPDGTLLMSAGTKIYSWRQGEKTWREVYDAALYQLGPVTRMAVAPDGRTLAIVVNEPARP